MSIDYNPRIATNGLVMYLDAANPRSYPGTGVTWYDLTGNNNNTNITGSVYTTDNNGAINLNDGNEALTIANSSSLYAALYNSSFTFSTCVRSDNVVYPRSRHPLWIESNGPSAAIKGISIGEGAESTAITFEISDGTTYITQDINHTVAESTPYYRTFVFNKGQTFDYYVNAVLIGSINISTITGSVYSSGGINFGNTAGWRFIGNMYMMSLYNRALTQSEIKQNFNAIRGRYGI